MKNFVIFLSLFVTVNCYVSYKNYKLYDVIPNQSQFEALKAWEFIDGVDFFRLTAPNHSSKVLIAPETQNDFEVFLSRNNIVNSVMIEDYEVEVEKEREDMVKKRRFAAEFNVDEPNFEVYWSFDEMDIYLQSLATNYPNRITLENLLFSPEGRHVWAVKISSGVFGQKPIIGMETGMHAREWAAPPTSLYLIDKLVRNDTVAADLLARVDWLIVPMQNPDGYEHSRNVARLWRQNRRQITPTCIGADLNRNFEYSWREATASQTCGSLTYPGPYALSEPEDFALHTLMSRYRQNLKIYLSVHTFGDLVLFPWGYADNPGPLPLDNTDQHEKVGNIWRDVILAATNKDYLVVNSLSYFGNINGAVDDNMLAHNDVGSVMSFTLELTNGFNFLYPEDRIFALSQETFIGYEAMGHYVGETYG